MDVIEYTEGNQMKTKTTIKGILMLVTQIMWLWFWRRWQCRQQGANLTFLVDGVIYTDKVYDDHLWELPAGTSWVWLGDPWWPYKNPDFQMRRLYYGPRTEAIKYGLIKGSWRCKLKFFK